MGDRPSLSADRWAFVNGPEHMPVRSHSIGQIARASRAITSIGRILHNSIGDDMDGERCSGLDDLTKQNLAGAIECLADFIYDLTENMTVSSGELRGALFREEENHG